MLTNVLSMAVLLLPTVISLILDNRFCKNAKNAVSKFIFYLFANNIVLFSILFVFCFARFTPFETFDSFLMLLAAGVGSIAISTFTPVIIRKRLPKSIAKIIDFVLSHGIAFMCISLVCTVLLFVPRFFTKSADMIFVNGAFLWILSLSLALAFVGICGFKLIKEIKTRGGKSTVKKIKTHFKNGRDPEFLKQFGISALVDFAFAFSVIVFVPFETYLGNIKEFVFGFSSFWWIVALEGLLYALLLLYFEIALPKKLSKFVTGLVFGVIAASYIQGNFLNGSMGLMNGSEAAWDSSTLIINAVIWFAIAIIPAVLTLFGFKFLKTAAVIGCVLVVGMQSTALVSMLASVEQPSIETRMTKKGLYEVAPDNNVFVFVVDCFDQDNVDEMLVVDPHILDALGGFTCYDNVTGSYCYTHISVPYLLSGERIPQYNPSDEQLENALNQSPYYNALTENVSNVGIYTEEFCLVGDNERQKIDNLGSSENSQLNVDTTTYAAQYSSFYRVLPLFLKNRFSYTSEDFNWAMLSTKDGTEFYGVSPRSDANMLDYLQAKGLKVNPDYENGCFRFIHTSGAHEPFKLDKNGNYSLTSTSRLDSALGSMKLVSQYLKRLQEAGVYENSTIIITSDHGTCKSYRIEDNAELSINPIMFYKPAGADSDKPCARSTAPVSHDDIFPTVMDAFGFEYESETGMDLDEITEDTERTRYYYWCRREPDLPDSNWAFIHLEYAINGDSRIEENWKPTGNYSHCNGWDE